VLGEHRAELREPVLARALVAWTLLVRNDQLEPLGQLVGSVAPSRSSSGMRWN
jgi:hypothetical protein